MISLSNVTKAYKDIMLFDNINLDFPEGRKILIRGINGAGKSVLLKLLVGYSTPNKGSIDIDGCVLHEDVDFIPNAGVSINAPEFINYMSGLDNLLYLADIKKHATKEKIIELAKYFDLEKYLHKKYKTYSLGMKQKMRIIQALMEDPKYLILDEPFDALDEYSRELLVNLLNKQIEKGVTLIFTSHMNEYEDFSDIIYEIVDNKLVAKKTV